MNTAQINNQGGPAFPTTPENHAYSGQRGMTLRDYFAAKALTGLLSVPSDDYADQTMRRDDYAGFCRNFAESAYEMADAMLAQRSKA